MEVPEEWDTQNMVEVLYLYCYKMLTLYFLVGGIGGKGGSVIFVAKEGKL